jgi:hypothetical protein
MKILAEDVSIKQCGARKAWRDLRLTVEAQVLGCCIYSVQALLKHY